MQSYSTTEKSVVPLNHDGYKRKLDVFREAMLAGNYEGMLSTGLRHMVMARVEGVPYALLAAEIAEKCTAEVKKKYPYELLRLAYELYAGGLADEHASLMGEIKEILSSLPLPAEEKRQLKGEWLIVSALPATRDIKRLVDIYEQAAELMSRPSAVIDAADPITLGIHGMPGVYLLRPGMADEVRKLIPPLAELYSRFSGETLCGLEELYDASLAYYRGNMKEARRLTYKAIYLLEKTKQDVLQISAGEQLGMIATHQGDVECFDETID